jgi:putative flippase GtrA
VKSLLFQKKQFLLYCLIGGGGTLLDFSIYSLLLQCSGLGYQAANAAGYGSGTTLSFILNSRYNFRVRDRLAWRFLCFFGVALLGYATTAGTLHLLVEICHLDKYLAKLAALIVVVFLQYNLNRLLSFRKIS